MRGKTRINIIFNLNSNYLLLIDNTIIFLIGEGQRKKKQKQLQMWKLNSHT